MVNVLSSIFYSGLLRMKTDEVVQRKRITPKARLVAAVLNSLIPISKAEICLILPEASHLTIEFVLGLMVKNSTIKQISAGRISRHLKEYTVIMQT